MFLISDALLGLFSKVSALQGLSELNDQLRQNPYDKTPLLTGINIILGTASASANTCSFLANRTAIGKAAHLKLTGAAKVAMTGNNLIAFCVRVLCSG